MASTSRKSSTLVTGQSQPPVVEWEGRGTIGYVSEFAKQNFQSLPSEVHERLQQAATRLSEDNSAPRVILERRCSEEVAIDSPSMSTIKRYELARFQVDNPTRGTKRNPTPASQEAPDSINSPGQKRKADPRDLYLMHLASSTPLWKAPKPHLLDAESFRAKLADTSLAVITKFARRYLVSAELLPTALRCFGSFLSGFALPNSRLDTLMELNDSVRYRDRTLLIVILVKAFLDEGLCAGLARSPYSDLPMLKVCQNANPDLVQTLKKKYDYIGWLTPRETSFLNIYFPESLGIQCHIHFLETDLMYHSSNLMRCYHHCDERVEKMALVIKKWAKTRNISSPEKGTLSPYGYMLMLLHYLLHIVEPPVVPNLQYTRIDEHRHVSAGYSYWSNRNNILAEAKAGNLTSNQQSLPSLLRGFFAYYSPQPRGARNGTSTKSSFIWKNDVVSLGSESHLLKSKKGWAPKIPQKGRPPRWNFLAIEDPFNQEHNVAERVRPDAVSLIKDEFVRAHTIVSRTRLIPGTGWEWRTDEGTIGDDLFAIRNPTCSELDWVDQPNRNKRATNKGNENSPNRPTRTGNNRDTKAFASVGTENVGEMGVSTSPIETRTASAIERSPTVDTWPPSSNPCYSVGHLSHAEETVVTEHSFRLDPMQLRDIETILAGGNGCRR